MPDASASRLASGLALTRSPFCAGAADAFSEAIDDASADFASSGAGRGCGAAGLLSVACAFSDFSAFAGFEGAAPVSSPSAARSAITVPTFRSEEHTSELQSLMRIPYAVFCLTKKKQQ